LVFLPKSFIAVLQKVVVSGKSRGGLEAGSGAAGVCFDVVLMFVYLRALGAVNFSLLLV
jgi:hypothetical protein